MIAFDALNYRTGEAIFSKMLMQVPQQLTTREMESVVRVEMQADINFFGDIWE